MNIIETNNLTKSYVDFTAVSGINLHIPQGKVYGFLGPNGAGKSTTMKMFLGLTKPTYGTFKINGKKYPESRVEILKEVGSFIEAPAFYGNLSGRENLEIVCKILGLPKSAVTDALELVGLTQHKDRLAKKYSLGMKQRLGLASALIGRPPILILDEPTNGLDPNQIVEIRNLIKEIAEDHSVLLSTHILSEVQATCNDIRMIEHGKVVFSGSMKDFDNYVVPSSFTVTFALPPSIEELAKIEHVLNIEELYPGTFRIRFDDDENITERVVALSIQNGWRLKEITMERCSLDIIFAQLSGKLKNNI